MKIDDLLQRCIDVIRAFPSQRFTWGISLTWPPNYGRFPFHGRGVEKLSESAAGTNYYVPVKIILSRLAKGL